MKILDVAGPILLVVPLVFFIFSMVIGFLEAIILKRIARYEQYRKALLHAFLVNVISTLVGLLLLEWIDESYSKLVVLWMLTVCIEALALFLVNRKQTRVKLFQASLLMNVASYILLFILIPLTR